MIGSGRRPPAGDDRRARALRARMVETQLRRRGIVDPRVLAAFERVPRHAFIEGGEPESCYGDEPLPIGHGQTISQPYVVAFALQAAAVQSSETALEIGSGSGYQTALLAELAAHVKGVEYYDEFTRAAARRLADLGYANVEVRTGDGSTGWPEGGSFDVIIGSAAPPRIPEPLTRQLAPGGRLVMPVGSGLHQELVRVTRDGDDLVRRSLLPVRFVPLLGAA